MNNIQQMLQGASGMSPNQAAAGGGSELQQYAKMLDSLGVDEKTKQYMLQQLMAKGAGGFADQNLQMQTQQNPYQSLMQTLKAQ